MGPRNVLVGALCGGMVVSGIVLAAVFTPVLSWSATTCVILPHWAAKAAVRQDVDASHWVDVDALKYSAVADGHRFDMNMTVYANTAGTAARDVLHAMDALAAVLAPDGGALMCPTIVARHKLHLAGGKGDDQCDAAATLADEDADDDVDSD